LANTDCRDRTLKRPHLHAHRVRVGFLHGSEDDGIGAQLAPRVERDLFRRARDRNGRVRVARNHVELALEVQVIPQHLTERFRGIRHVGRERYEIGHRVPRRRAGFAADDQLNLRRLLRRRRRRCLRHLGGHDDDRARGHERAQRHIHVLSLHLT
jgi:hypothetical protein